MDSYIRWKRSDYMKLSHAVRRFNNLVEKLDNEAISYLPESKAYSDIKKHITTRKELNRVLNSLNRANEENLIGTQRLSSGEELSKWEMHELNLARNRALRNLQKEKETILGERESIGMGDERLSEIRAIERSFENVNNVKGNELKNLIKRIMNVGRSDYKMGKAELFRKNFYKALDGISNFQNYEVLKKELDKIKNPEAFYEYVKKSPILMDLFLWYKESDTLFYGGFMDNEDAFDSTLIFHLGIDADVGM